MAGYLPSKSADCSPDLHPLPRSTYDGEERGPSTLQLVLRAHLQPKPESLGAISPENEPEALIWLLYSVLAYGHPWVLEPQIQV